MTWVLYNENNHEYEDDNINFIVNTVFDMQFWDDPQEKPSDYEQILEKLKTSLKLYNINMIDADFLSMAKNLEAQIIERRLCDFQKHT